MNLLIQHIRRQKNRPTHTFLSTHESIYATLVIFCLCDLYWGYIICHCVYKAAPGSPQVPVQCSLAEGAYRGTGVAQRLIILWLTGTITRFLVLIRDACMLARSQLQDSHTSHHVIAQVLFPSPSPPKSLFAVSINCWFVGTSTNSDDTDSLKRIKNVSRTPS